MQACPTWMSCRALCVSAPLVPPKAGSGTSAPNCLRSKHTSIRFLCAQRLSQMRTHSWYVFQVEVHKDTIFLNDSWCSLRSCYRHVGPHMIQWAIMGKTVAECSTICFQIFAQPELPALEIVLNSVLHANMHASLLTPPSRRPDSVHVSRPACDSRRKT